MARINMYGKAQILVGDSTSHGGVVINGSPTSVVDGIPVVRKGDKVFCPKCSPHVFVVSEGFANASDTDAKLPLAGHGHLTSCGATLIAKPASLPMVQSAMATLKGASVPVSMTSTSNDQYDQHFCLRDNVTDEPLVDCYYSMTANGQTIYGRTDANGLTSKVTADQALDVEVEIIELGQQESSGWLKD